MTRLHFALNCASRSCPPLHNEPFEGRNLERVLESLTNAFLNENPQALQETESEVRLSKIFKWYEEDFGFGLRLAVECKILTSL